MTRASVNRRARTFVERGMVDTCRIRRPLKGGTDRDTGRITQAWADPDPYVGPCLVEQRTAAAADVDAGQAARLIVTRLLKLPLATSTAVRAGDVVEITAIGAASDPGLLGRHFIVHAEAAKTNASARRLGIEEVTS